MTLIKKDREWLAREMLTLRFDHPIHLLQSCLTEKDGNVIGLELSIKAQNMIKSIENLLAFSNDMKLQLFTPLYQQQLKSLQDEKESLLSELSALE